MQVDHKSFKYRLRVIGLLLRERSSESSEFIKDASRTARCLRKVLRTNKLRRS